MGSMNKPNILDCTLRDGSYSIDFQFTAKDTSIILSGLQNLGFKYIEIGHGLGLNASSLKKKKAAETDETYLKIARDILDTSMYGMFFIPNIGRMEDLDLAYHYDMDFVRIGTNVTDVNEAKKPIQYAKNLGFTVFSNLMKSYTLPPEKFAEKAKLVEEFGADVIVLVDSAGGMLPQDIQKYISAMKKNGVKTQIGFHGHNNLSLAVGNSLEAIRCGADFIDTSLCGIGRSAGNAPTEVMVSILKKMGYTTNIDIFKVMDFAEKIIGPLLHDQKIP